MPTFAPVDRPLGLEVSEEEDGDKVLSPWVGGVLLVVVREPDDDVAELPRLAAVYELEGGLVATAPDVMPAEGASAAVSNFTCALSKGIAEPSAMELLVMSI